MRGSVMVSASQWPAEFVTEFVAEREAELLDFSSLPATCVFGVESALTSHS